MRGLLYTDPLILPVTCRDNIWPMPHPLLHVCKVSKKSTIPDSASVSDSESSATTACADNWTPSQSPASVPVAQVDVNDSTPVIETVSEDALDDDSFKATSCCANPSLVPVVVDDSSCNDLLFTCSCCHVMKSVDEPLSIFECIGRMW
jgi:hypothetical protein